MNITSSSLINGLNGFCGQLFWDPEILESPTLPLFTRCFQHTVLVWIPFLFISIISPILIFQISVNRKQPLPWTYLLLAKFVKILLDVNKLKNLFLDNYNNINICFEFLIFPCHLGNSFKQWAIKFCRFCLSFNSMRFNDYIKHIYNRMSKMWSFNFRWTLHNLGFIRDLWPS